MAASAGLGPLWWGVLALLEACRAATPDVASGGAFHYGQWTTSDGLPQNTVRALAQTKDGFLWIGTWRGLATHDGTEVARYPGSEIPGPGSISVTALAPDGQQGLWMATQRGLYHVAQHGDPPRFEPLTTAECRGVAVVGDEVLVGGPWGMAAGKPGTLKVRKDGIGILSATASAGGRAWIASSVGIFRLSPPFASQAPVLVAKATNHSSVVCNGNTAWAAADADLLEIDEPTGRVRRRWPGLGARPLLVDRAGRLWLSRKTHGTPALGLATLDAEAGVLRPHDLREIPAHEEVLCGIEDSAGTLWFGTAASGVLRLTPARVEVFGPSQGLPDEDVWSISASADGGLWVQTKAGPARRVGAAFETTPWPRGEEGGRAILALHSDKAIAVSGASILRLAPGGFGTEPHPRAEMLFIGRDRTGRRVAGGLGGIWSQVDNGPWERVPGLPVARWIGWETSPEGEAFAGSLDQGLWERTNAGSWQRVPLGDSVEAAAVLWWEDGRWPWAGSTGGLYRRNEQGAWDRWTTRDGLVEDLVLAIQPDDRGHLWLLGHHGLSRIGVADLKRVARMGGQVEVLRVSERDGMLSSEGNSGFPASARDQDGSLWFATTRGAVRIHPDAVQAAPPPTPVIVEARDISRGPDSPGVSTRSRHVFDGGSGRALRLRFTAPSPSGGDRVRIRYQLKGIDGAPHEAGKRREALYAGLKPGAYAFEVRATADDGPWDGPPAVWRFELRPLWWERADLRVAAAVLALAFLGGLFLRRLRLQRHIADLQRNRAVEEERRRLARDLHDGLGSEIARMNVAAATGSVDVGAFSRDLLRRLQTLVWLTDPAEDRLDSLCRAMASRVERFFPHGLPAVRVDLPAHPGPRVIDGRWRREFTAWLDEGLANIARHAHAREVRLRIQPEGDGLIVVLSDDGVGFDPAQNPAGGRGIANLRSRIAALGGHLELVSAPGAGTEIKAWVPFPRPTPSTPSPARA